MPLEALQYDEDGHKAIFRLLDQRELPLRTTYIDIPGTEAAWHAIKVILIHQDNLGTPIDGL